MKLQERDWDVGWRLGLTLADTASRSRGGARLPVRQSWKMRAKAAEMSQLLDGFKPDSSNRLA